MFDLGPLGTYGLNGLAVDASGNVYAADTGRNRVLVFSAAGRLVQQVGHGGFQFVQAHGDLRENGATFIISYRASGSGASRSPASIRCRRFA